MKVGRILIWVSRMIVCLCLAACGEPEQKFKVRVSDEHGKPMAGIECKVWFNRQGKSNPLDSYAVTGTTDTGGNVALQGETLWYQTSVEASHPGYYKSNLGKLWITGKNGDRWEPWPVEVELVMKKIRNPHAMYAVKAFDNFRFKIPNLDSSEVLGFDLEVYDWVKPHGNGRIADFLITARRRDPSDSGYQPRGWVDITFPNSADGIQRIEDSGGSLLVGPTEAPGGGYKHAWSFANRNEPGETGPADTAAFVFRTRTVLDEGGELVSGHYGKIDGGISSALYHERPSFTLTYYFNKEPNDRRLEWDRKTNLVAGLEEYHWPKRP